MVCLKAINTCDMYNATVNIYSILMKSSIFGKII